MNRISRPSMMRLAREPATYEDPDLVLNALGAMLAEHKNTKPPKASKAPDAEDYNLKFNQLLNSSKDPRAMYNALLALAPLIRELRNVKSEEAKQ